MYKYLLRLFVQPDDIHAMIGLLEARPFSLTDSALVELFDGVEPPFDAMSLLSDESSSRLSDKSAGESCKRLRGLLNILAEKRDELDFSSFVVDAFELSHFYFRFFDDGADVALVESVTKTIFGVVEGLVAEKRGKSLRIPRVAGCFARKEVAGGGERAGISAGSCASADDSLCKGA